jgi:hypothetical protein
MSEATAAKQFSFRLPEGLIEKVERCTSELRATGLDVTRTDVVRLLLKHALDTTHCRVDLLLAPKSSKKRPQQELRARRRSSGRTPGPQE